MPSLEVGEGIEGLILSIILWIAMTIFCVIALIMIEAIFWFSLFVILTMIYWVFFRALKLVFNKISETKDKLGISIFYSFSYTIMFTAWIFGIAYLVELVKYG